MMDFLYKKIWYHIICYAFITILAQSEPISQFDQVFLELTFIKIFYTLMWYFPGVNICQFLKIHE